MNNQPKPRQYPPLNLDPIKLRRDAALGQMPRTLRKLKGR